MESSDDISIKTVVELKREIEELQEIVNFLKIENFDYALKCNSMENALSNVNTIIKNNSVRLSDGSNNFCGILEVCGGTQLATKIPEPKEKAKEVIVEKSTEQNVSKTKAQIVKPHMVNGTILYIPTIKLTRVSDLHLQSRTEKSLQSEIENTLPEGNSNTSDPPTIDEMEDESIDVIQDQQVTLFEEASEASSSKSTSHSTLLSGTFQEVKIFLNQVNQDSLDGEPRNSSNLRRRSKHSSSRNRYRSGPIPESITRRKRNEAS